MPCRICQNVPSLQVCALRQLRLLSLMSLPRGPQLSALLLLPSVPPRECLCHHPVHHGLKRTARSTPPWTRFRGSLIIEKFWDSLNPHNFTWFPKNIYNSVLNHSKIPLKFMKEPQTLQEPLLCQDPPSTSTIPEIPRISWNDHFALKMFQSPYLLIQSSVQYDSCAIHVFIHNKLFATLYLFVYCVLALRNFVLEPLFEDFQEQVLEEPKVFFSGQQGKCPWSTLHLLLFLSIL
jgi:hypothetical protein